MVFDCRGESELRLTPPKTKGGNMTEREQILEFVDKVWKLKNDLMPQLKYQSPLFPALSEYELAIDWATKQIKEALCGLK